MNVMTPEELEELRERLGPGPYLEKSPDGALIWYSHLESVSDLNRIVPPSMADDEIAAAQAAVDAVIAEGQRHNAEMLAQFEAEQADREVHRASAREKLAAIGLTEDEVAALLG